MRELVREKKRDDDDRGNVCTNIFLWEASLNEIMSFITNGAD